MILATKGGIQPPKPYDSSAGYLRSACEASLSRLGVDVIDIYQVHRPDLLAHPGEVAEVLTELRDAGKVGEVGISNHSVAQARALQAYLDFPIATSQPEFSPLHLDPLVDGTLDLCMELGMAPLAWSPLAGGRLVGELPAGDLRAEAVDRGVRPHRRRAGSSLLRRRAGLADGASLRSGADRRYPAGGPDPRVRPGHRGRAHPRALVRGAGGRPR